MSTCGAFTREKLTSTAGQEFKKKTTTRSYSNTSRQANY